MPLQIDFLGIMTRLRPGSRYLWRDSGSTYADILEWQDPNTTQPTEAECLAEWDIMLAERAADKAQSDLIRNTEQSAITDYAALPDWVRTFTATDATDYVNSQIWNGWTQTQIDAWIDANVTNIATAKTALKQVAAAVVNMRGLFLIVAKLLIYIRDLVIRFRKLI